MRALLLLFASFLAIVLPGAARAMLPESGWYWNPAESGRGFNIEVQDDKLFFAAFVYAPDGTAVWYFSGDRMSSDRTYTAPLYQTFGGQCIGCSYPGSPGLIQKGNVSITFTTPESAVITALGVSMTVQRHDFSTTNLFNPAALYGEWSTTEGDPVLPVYFGDRLIFNQPYTGSTGLLYAAGYRTGNSARDALGRCESRNLCVIAFSYSSTSDEYYTLQFHGFGRMEGILRIVPRGASPPTTGGMYFLAHRTKSKAYVQGFSAPAMSKSAGEADLEPIAAAKQRLQATPSERAKALDESFAKAGAAALQHEVAAELARRRAEIAPVAAQGD